MTRSIARGVKFDLREQVIAEGRAYGTLSRERHLPPDIFAEELKMMIDRWRHAGIHGNSATAGEQAAEPLAGCSAAFEHRRANRVCRQECAAVQDLSNR